MKNNQSHIIPSGPFLNEEEMRVLMSQPLLSVHDVHGRTNEIAMEIATGRRNPFAEETKKN